MTNNEYRTAYDILIKVLRDGTYINLLMKENSNKKVAKLVYGVLDHFYELNYIIDYVAKKNVKNNIKPILYIAVYAQKYLNTPVNVVISDIKEMLKSIGKSALEGFIIAVIMKTARGEYEMPAKSDKNYTEVKYNMPSWLVGMYKKDYPDRFEELIFEKEFPQVHIRLNKNTSETEIYNADRDAIKTLTGFYVKNNKEIGLLNLLGKITYIGYGSSLIAESINADSGMEILDACAAPGGKAVMLAQTGASVTACDIHEHRVELLHAYADRMKTGMNIYLQDATKFLKKWEGKFDVVLADVPCSGFGVAKKKRDVVFNRTYNDIIGLTELQYKILSNVKNYVKDGGLLVYSTCTIFKKENSEIIKRFLSENSNFSMEKIALPFENNGDIQFLPDGKGMEGFYLCHLRKN